MSPALRPLVELLAAIVVEDHLREREDQKPEQQREPKSSNNPDEYTRAVERIIREDGDPADGIVAYVQQRLTEARTGIS